MDIRNSSGAYNNDHYNYIQKNPYGVIHENKNDRNRRWVRTRRLEI